MMLRRTAQATPVRKLLDNFHWINSRENSKEDTVVAISSRAVRKHVGAPRIRNVKYNGNQEQLDAQNQRRYTHGKVVIAKGVGRSNASFDERENELDNVSISLEYFMVLDYRLNRLKEDDKL